MPEDEGVNGDMWTSEACRLFKMAGWDEICSENLDIADAIGKKRGLDAIFSYRDGFRNNKLKQGVFIEAKRYATTSLSEAALKDWIVGLEEKINSLRRSPGLLDKYPPTKDIDINTGVIAVWFHDLVNYPSFEPKFIEFLGNIKMTHGRIERDLNNRVFVLENTRILKLASLFDTVRDWETKELGRDEERTLNYYYPSSTLRGNPVNEFPVLNLEYIFSQFVLAKATKRVAENFQDFDVVFYFGELDLGSFQRLGAALQAFDMVNARNELVVYKYKRETDEYRKIKSDVEEIFKSLGPKSVKIFNMVQLQDLPAWMVDGD